MESKAPPKPKPSNPSPAVKPPVSNQGRPPDPKASPKVSHSPAPAKAEAKNHPTPPKGGVWGVEPQVDDGIVPHQAISHLVEQVKGLECADLPLVVVSAALEEIGHLEMQGSAAHGHLEMGSPFYASSEVAKVSDYGAVQNLIKEAHISLKHVSPDWDNINVICRKYEKNGALSAHIDRVEQCGNKSTPVC